MRAAPRDEASTRRASPPRSFFALLFVALAAPFLVRMAGTSVGTYSMFTSLRRYRLELWADDARVRPTSLRAHLGRDAARVIAVPDAGSIGETNVELLGADLEAIVELVCRLHPAARRARARLSVAPLGSSNAHPQIEERSCAGSGP